MKIKGIPVISAIKRSHHSQIDKPIKKASMKVQNIHVMSAIIKQDGKKHLMKHKKIHIKEV